MWGKGGGGSGERNALGLSGQDSKGSRPEWLGFEASVDSQHHTLGIWLTQIKAEGYPRNIKLHRVFFV